MSSKQYPESLIRNRERLIEKAKQLNLFSDAMAKMVFTDSGACEHVLRILSGIDSLVIKEIVLKWSLTNLHPRILLWMFL